VNTCDECGEPYDPAEGCQHDGRQLCAYCFHRCPECLAAIRDDYDAEMATDGRWT
jgi:hypothetical protein